MLCVGLRLAHLNTAYPGLKLFGPLLCGLLLFLNEADLVVDGVQLLLMRRMQGVNLTINAPVFFMEREVMDFWREICITRAHPYNWPK
jgi:hypothetical protein